MLRGLKSSPSLQGNEPQPEPSSQSAPPSQQQASAIAPRKPLKVSSRNVLQGKIQRIIKGSVNTEVTLEIVHTVELTSIITTTSAEALELAEGSNAYAVIKSSDIVIAMD